VRAHRLGGIALTAFLAGCAQRSAPVLTPPIAPAPPPIPRVEPPRPVQAQASRLVVTPVFYVPADVAFDAQAEVLGSNLIAAHLALAQQRYQRLLAVDTFLYAIEQPITFHSPMTTSDLEVSRPDTAHAMARELLTWRRETRMSSRHVFVTLMVRAPERPCGGQVRCMGGGRTFNGPPGTGGGFIQLEAATLFAGKNFHSTLVHELGHAFGLPHADCHGESMREGRSIMSYNRRHWSKGLSESGEGVLTAEDQVTLARNPLAFPRLAADPTLHGRMGGPLVGVNGECDLGPMDASIGPLESFRQW
jgi:hypothetical protein